MTYLLELDLSFHTGFFGIGEEVFFQHRLDRHLRISPQKMSNTEPIDSEMLRA